MYCLLSPDHVKVIGYFKSVEIAVAFTMANPDTKGWAIVQYLQIQRG